MILSKPTGTIMTTVTAITDQFRNPCNKNLCFIKPKQVLNCKVHNLGKTVSRFLFLEGSYMRGFTVTFISSKSTEKINNMNTSSKDLKK